MTASRPAAITPLRSSPSDARNSARTVVGNRVCTTDCSVAIVSSITSVASSAAGVDASAVIVVVGVEPAMARRRSTTSVVVPERVIATMRSYRLPAGNSDAGKASVSPSPAASRSAA